MELVRNDNPFSRSESQSLQQLTGDVSGIKKNLDTLLNFFMQGKKESFLNFETMLLLLGFFADTDAPAEGVKKAQEFLKEKEAEFDRFSER